MVSWRDKAENAGFCVGLCGFGSRKWAEDDLRQYKAGEKESSKEVDRRPVVGFRKTDRGRRTDGVENCPTSPVSVVVFSMLNTELDVSSLAAPGGLSPVARERAG